jgi:hypothetical protein
MKAEQAGTCNRGSRPPDGQVSTEINQPKRHPLQNPALAAWPDIAFQDDHEDSLWRSCNRVGSPVLFCLRRISFFRWVRECGSRVREKCDCYNQGYKNTEVQSGENCLLRNGYRQRTSRAKAHHPSHNQGQRHEDRRIGLGEESLSCVEAEIQFICRLPELHVKITGSCRRVGGCCSGDFPMRYFTNTERAQ